MSTRRVAITGLGAVTALGADTEAFDAGLREGRSAIGEVTLFSTEGFRTHLAAEAVEPVIEGRISYAPASRPDRFGIAAALEAAEMAGLARGDFEGAACIFGTGTGGASLTEVALRTLMAGGSPDSALLVPHQPCSVTDLVARRLDARGPRTTIMTACSSSATAIGYAGDLIRLGRVDVAIAGGAEGLCGLTYAGFNALRATSPEPCRPFDEKRKGLTLGEGGAVLILEEERRARARGATILGYLAGWGVTADAHHMTAPHPEGDGAARAMSAALADARLPADAVDYLNAHGTATPHNDAAEVAAIKRVFGAHAARLPISSTKSMVGHTLGAAGAVEAVASLLAMRGGYLPPTANLETPDPSFGLDFVPGKSRPGRIGVAMSSSFAFGGNNTVLVFTRG